MLEIKKFTCENLTKAIVTDRKHPVFAFQAASDQENVQVAKAVLTVNGWTKDFGSQQIGLVYAGKALQAFQSYEARLTIEDNFGNQAGASLVFETGRLDTGWQADWITDGDYHFTAKSVSPRPMLFRKTIHIDKKVLAAKIYATAIGTYELFLDHDRVGDRYFAPGFTSYKTTLLYQTYDLTDRFIEPGDHELQAVVAGGWAVGAFVFTRKNRITAKRQALLLELRILYEDGTSQVIGTSPDWQVSMQGKCRAGDIYDGEVYDARVDVNKIRYRFAARETLKIHPKIIADDGAPVKAHEYLAPKLLGQKGETYIYDFGQNFAGIVDFEVRAKEGQEILIRHAEILNPDGTLNTDFLRTARAEIRYTCKEGLQHYSPHFTYMGFRYISVKGAEPDQIRLGAYALYSDLAENGSFSCSNGLINRLQENIRWGAKSNLMDIPTDCPQRDERMGWTGDIAVFAPTACYNFDMSRFLDKWLRDMRSEQLPTGGIPNTIPSQGYGFPATMPVMAVDFWGDASVLVPWAEYQARGDIGILQANYSMMKKYVEACRRWAAFGSFGKNRYIWNTFHMLHFGDWVAADVPQMAQWQKRSKWTATASLAHTADILSKVADILGKKEDKRHYHELFKRVSDAYATLLMDGQGGMADPFQTAYVLPVYFGMLGREEQKKAAANLAALVKENDYCIGTGFPGTPFILFALADNGQEETAFRMLENTKCPSWLYEVKAGATTIWERWDGLDEKGSCPIGDDGTDTMISYNHYASGAVGDFLYKRVLGVEATSPAYKTFRIKPLPGGSIRQASGSVDTPYGTIEASWTLSEGGKMSLDIRIPVSTSCQVILPSGKSQTFGSGIYYIEG